MPESQPGMSTSFRWGMPCSRGMGRAASIQPPPSRACLVVAHGIAGEWHALAVGQAAGQAFGGAVPHLGGHGGFGVDVGREQAGRRSRH